MLSRSKLYRIIFSSALLYLLVACAGNTTPEPATTSNPNHQYLIIGIDTLGEGTEIQSAGLQLMDNPPGMIGLSNENQMNDSVLIVAVHGYQSRGYEWITGLKNLTDHYGSLFFFRYDWDRCPDQIAGDLAHEIKALKRAGNYKRVLLFAHSYGGVVTTYTVSQLADMQVESHVIAAPLAGFPRLFDHCESLKYDESQKLIYPEWAKSVQVIQHRTVHGQDGAFRDMELDPQEIGLPFHQVQKLPPTMNGHRLGHNWSVTWVLDQYVGKPHRH